jgi:hypothetical protein
MIQYTGHFSRMSFHAHVEAMKQKIMAQGGDRASIIVPVLTQLQEDINQWTAGHRYKRTKGSRFVMDWDAAGYQAKGF